MRRIEAGGSRAIPCAARRRHQRKSGGRRSAGSRRQYQKLEQLARSGFGLNCFPPGREDLPKEANQVRPGPRNSRKSHVPSRGKRVAVLPHFLAASGKFLNRTAICRIGRAGSAMQAWARSMKSRKAASGQVVEKMCTKKSHRRTLASPAARLRLASNGGRNEAPGKRTCWGNVTCSPKAARVDSKTSLSVSRSGGVEQRIR